MTDNNKFVPQAQTYEVRYLEVKEPSKISKLAGYLGLRTVENCSSCSEGSPGRNKAFRIKVALEGRLFGARNLTSGYRKEWFYNTDDAIQAADDIIKKNEPWRGMDVTGGNRSRVSAKIWDCIHRHQRGYDIDGETAGSFTDS